jgi:hypothetical protein
MQGLGRARQIELADKLGLRDSMRLLQLGPQAIEEMTTKAKALGVTTAEDAKVSEEFNDALVDLWSVTKHISRLFTRVLAPVLEDIVDGFTDWWIANRKIIEQNMPKWVDQFTTALKLLSVAMGAFLAMRVLTHLYQMIALMRGLTLATLAANAAFFLLPLLISALGLAFIALVEDAKTFFEDGESFIGDMLEKYPQWEGELRTVAAILGVVYYLTTKILEGWEKIFGLFDDFSFDNIKEVLGNIPGFIGHVTGLSTIEGTGAIPESKEMVSNLYNSTQEEVSSAYKTVVEKIDITVQGGEDTAEEIASKVYDVFSQQTSQDLNSTVDQ